MKHINRETRYSVSFVMSSISEVSSDSVWSDSDYDWSADTQWKIVTSKNEDREARRIEKSQSRKDEDDSSETSEVSSDSYYSGSDALREAEREAEWRNKERKERRSRKARMRQERLELLRLTNKCNQCSKSYTTKTNLKRHIRVEHDQQKPFKCEICLKRFSHRWCQNNHTKKCSQKFDKIL